MYEKKELSCVIDQHLHSVKGCFVMSPNVYARRLDGLI